MHLERNNSKSDDEEKRHESREKEMRVLMLKGNERGMGRNSSRQHKKLHNEPSKEKLGFQT